ncbi:MAG TPA: FAD-dependent oxidoreductase [Acetobacteraceae bacterium]|nr:FAD-dependent oxidoreductase [Acetobacteraceae bacterium]
MKRIVVLGGGFAGLWAAIGAARKRDELGISAQRIEIVLIDRSDWHAIRVRNYEADLTDVRVGFNEILSPIGIGRVRGEVEDIDLDRQRIAVRGRSEPIGYDRLVFALGSGLVKPSLPGLAEHVFDVDTYEAAARLGNHLAALSQRPSSIRRGTVLVVGAGLTGIEVATEMPARLGPLAGRHVILADHAPWIGSNMGEEARAVIDEALGALEIETRPGITVVSVDEGGAILAGGDRIDTETIIWCAGMRSHSLTARFPVSRDRFGRLPVDPFLKVKRVEGVFAAGDSASLELGGTHTSVMSCQHARPMGRYAGHNVVCDLLGKPMLPLRIDWYVTVLDLGPWGAVYTQGWDRHVVLKGEAAKRVKRTINCERIYPPLSGGRKAILEAAAALVQPPPAMH